MDEVIETQVAFVDIFKVITPLGYQYLPIFLSISTTEKAISKLSLLLTKL